MVLPSADRKSPGSRIAYFFCFLIFQIKNISIPLMRQLANMKLRLVEIILDILHLVNTEKKLKELREGSLTKIVEEFVRLTPHSASVEQVSFFL